MEAGEKQLLDKTNDNAIENKFGIPLAPIDQLAERWLYQVATANPDKSAVVTKCFYS